MTWFYLEIVFVSGVSLVLITSLTQIKKRMMVFNVCTRKSGKVWDDFRVLMFQCTVYITLDLSVYFFVRNYYKFCFCNVVYPWEVNFGEFVSSHNYNWIQTKLCHCWKLILTINHSKKRKYFKCQMSQLIGNMNTKNKLYNMWKQRVLHIQTTYSYKLH